MRDVYGEFRALDTVVFGVNEADAASHQSFIDNHNFPFDLLIDEGFEVATRYDAMKPEGDRINRKVVIVGMNGRIIFRSAGAPAPADLLAAIREAEDLITVVDK